MIKIKRFGWLLAGLLLGGLEAEVIAQTANFTYDATICQNESLTLSNTSTGASSYHWDFCEGDLSVTPSSSVYGSVGFNDKLGISMEEADGEIYAFITDYGSNLVYRLSYGTDVTNEDPLIESLGSISGLNGAYDVDLIEDDGVWYGYVVSQVTNSLIKLTFGNGIDSAPTAVSTISVTGTSINSPRRAVLVESDGSYYALVGGNNTLLLSLGSDLSLNDATSTDLGVSGSVFGLSFVREGSTWYGVALGLTTVNVASLGSDLSTPVISVSTPTYSASLSGNARDLVMFRDLGSNIGFVQSQDGNIYRVDFGDMTNGSLPVTNLGGFSELTSALMLGGIKIGTSHYLLGSNEDEADLIRLFFDNNCAATSGVSTEETPSNISYTSDGTYNVTLTAFDSDSSIVSLTQQVTVTTDEAPVIDFEYTPECLIGPVTFSIVTSAMDITNYTWDFGDGNMQSGASLSSVDYEHADTGPHTVSLTVATSGGCSNVISKEIDFTSALGEVAASGYLVENGPVELTVTDLTNSSDAIASYSWTIDNNAAQTTNPATATFNSVGTFNYSVDITTTLGCMQTINGAVDITAADSPTVLFDVPASSCINESVTFTNNSFNATGYTWDFCEGDLSVTPTSSVYGSVGFDDKLGISIEESGGEIYAFITDYGSNLIYRLSYGTDFTNEDPLIESLGSISGLSGAFDVDLIEDDGIWYGYVVSQVTNSLIKLTFGDGIDASPTAVSDISITGTSPTSPRRTQLVKSGDSYYALLAGNNTLLLSLGSDLSLNDATSTDLGVSGSVFGLSFVREGNDWYGVAVGLTTVNVVSLGNDLSSPVVSVSTPTYSASLSSNVRDLVMFRDLGSNIAFVPTSGGDIYHVDFSDMTSSSLPVTNLGAFSELTNAQMLGGIKFGTDHYLLASNEDEGDLMRLFFDNNCAASTGVSSAETPSNISYTSDGTYNVTLTAFDSDSSLVSLTQQVTVTTDEAPVIDFEYTPECLIGPVTFSIVTSAMDITNYTWDFGDGNMQSGASLSSVDYEHATTGPHTVSLTVETSSGCSNSIAKDIDFTSELGEVATTGYLVENGPVELTVTDLTNSDDAIASYSWTIENNSAQTTNPATATFTSAGTFDYSVDITTTLGCMQTLDGTIEITAADSPTVLFDVPASSCINESVSFTNNSFNATGYSWDFCEGDLSVTPTSSVYGAVGFGNKLGMSFEESGGEVYAFITDYGNNLVYRLSYGSDITNQDPGIESLGSISGLDGAFDVDLIEDDGVWYGYVVSQVTNSLIKLTFGDGIASAPTGVSSLSITGTSPDSPRRVILTQNGSSYYALLAGNNSLLLSLGSDLSSNDATSTDLGIAESIFGLSFVREGSIWYAVAVGLTTVNVISLGNDLNSPTISLSTPTYSTSLSSNVRDLVMFRDLGSNIGFVPTSGGDIYRVDFSDMTGSSLTVTNLGAFSELDNAQMLGGIKLGSSYYLLSSNEDEGDLLQLYFDNGCTVSTGVSTDETPSNISYSSDGTYNVTLTAFDSDSSLVSLTQQVTVTTDEAPVIDFEYTPECLIGAVTFSIVTSATDITNYAWDFGDGNMQSGASLSSVDYEHATTGPHTVSLTVETSSGCSNVISKEIDFSAELGEVVVSGYQVENGPIELTVTDLTNSSDGIASYSWAIDNNSAQTTNPATATFSSAGTFNYSVDITTTLGCMQTLAGTVDISAADAPTVLFDVPASSCTNEAVAFTNNSFNATNYSWDFCEGDLSVTPTSSVYGSVGFDDKLGISLEESDGNVYAFITDYGSNLIYRLSYGADITNEDPTVESLGSISGLDGAFDVDLIEDDGVWYGYVVSQLDNSLIKLTFANGIASAPTGISNLTITGTSPNSPRRVILTKSGSSYYALLAGDNTLLLSLGTDLSLDDATSTDLGVSGSVFGLSFVREGSEWYGVALGLSTVSVVSLGNDLSSPTISISTPAYSSSLSSDARDLVMFRDLGSNVGFVPTSGGDIYRIDFTDMTGSTLAATNLGNFSELASVQMLGGIKIDGAHYLLSSNEDASDLLRLYFDDGCTASVGTSSDETPANISYSSDGTYHVTLTAFDSDSSVVSLTQQVTVTTDVAPVIDFEYTPECLIGPVTFSIVTSATDITNYSWDFGDGNMQSGASLSSVDYEHADTGPHTVSLTVETSGGCSNVISKEIDFTSVLGEVAISGYQVENGPVEMTVTDLTNSSDGIVSYSWTIDNHSAQTVNPATATFSDAGTYNYSVDITTTLGCSGTLAGTIDISTPTEPTPLFSTTTTNCQEENLVISNNSFNASSYSWDFCEGELSQVPQTTTMDVLNFDDKFGTATVVSGGEYFQFITDFGSNRIHRVEYGADITNTTPDVVRLGTIASLDGPYDLDLISDGGVWYGYIASQVNSKIIKLTFGNGINADPTEVSELAVTGESIDSPRRIRLIEQGSKYYAVIGGDVTLLLSLGTDLSEDDATATDLGVSHSIFGISAIRESSNWFVLAVGLGEMSRVNLGSNLDSPTATVEELSPSITLTNARDLVMFRDLGSNIGFVPSVSGNVYRVDFGDMTDTSPTVTDLGNFSLFSDLLMLDGIKIGSDHYLLTSDRDSDTMVRMYFDNQCAANTAVSTSTVPTQINFNTSGTYNITLTAFDTDGAVVSTTTQITVSSDAAPDITFSVDDSRCILNSNDFTSTSSSSGLTYDWDFNGEGSSSQENPSFQFSSTGDKSIVLNVDDGSCSNSYVLQTTIYPEPPDPTYSFASTDYCKDLAFNLTNSTDTTVYNGELSFSWTIPETGHQLSGADPSFNIATVGSITVQASSSIPGCTSDVVSTALTVNDLPNPEFSYSATCIGEITSFTNSTPDATTYSWDFGDSLTSTQSSPQHLYGDDGDFPVSLVATNAAGCATTVVDTVKVGAIPDAGFEVALPCEGEVTLRDTSSVANADIESWQWFLAGDLQSTLQSPELDINDPGAYEVTAVVRSTAGCEQQVTKQIVVSDAAEADFGVTTSCDGEPFSFADLSTESADNSIIARSWLVNGTMYEDSLFEHTFDEFGKFPVSLTVTTENLCTATYQDTITVLEAPRLGFENELVCQNDFSLLADTTVTSEDSVLSRSWYVNDLLVGNGASYVHRFVDAGINNVTLTVNTASGCSYELNKQIEVLPAARAAFQTNTTFGVPGTAVSFENLSEESDSYEWYIDETQVTTEENLSRVFTAAGNYEVMLLAFSSEGCADTAAVDVLIRNPEIDLVIQEMTLVAQDDQFSSIVLSVRNNSNLPVDNLRFTVQVEDQLPTRDVVEGFLDIGGSRVIQLDAGVPNLAEYICVEVSAVYDAEDMSPADNESCFNNEPQAIFEPPFPNPARDETTVRTILPVAGDVTISLVNLSGKTEISETYPNLEAGLHAFPVVIAPYDAGMYFIKIEYAGTVEITRIIKQ